MNHSHASSDNEFSQEESSVKADVYDLLRSSEDEVKQAIKEETYAGFVQSNQQNHQSKDRRSVINYLSFGLIK